MNKINKYYIYRKRIIMGHDIKYGLLVGPENKIVSEELISQEAIKKQNARAEARVVQNTLDSKIWGQTPNEFRTEEYRGDNRPLENSYKKNPIIKRHPKEVTRLEDDFKKVASILEHSEEEELNIFLTQNFFSKPPNYSFKILKINDTETAKKFYSKTLPAEQPINQIISTYLYKDDDTYKRKERREYVIEYLQNEQPVEQYIRLDKYGDYVSSDDGATSYAKYVYKMIVNAFDETSKQLKKNTPYHLKVIYFKKDSEFYIALYLGDTTDSTNMFHGVEHVAIHTVYNKIINIDYNGTFKNSLSARSFPENYTDNFVGFHTRGYHTKVLDHKSREREKIYNDAIEYAEERKRGINSAPHPSPPPTDDTSAGGGGKKTSKKEVLGKMRCIYKIPGDRKEYVKHKGKLITLKDYKMLNKKPKKVADKKPKKVTDKKPKKVTDKKPKKVTDKKPKLLKK
jgi:hypothetical protein